MPTGSCNKCGLTPLEVMSQQQFKGKHHNLNAVRNTQTPTADTGKYALNKIANSSKMFKATDFELVSVPIKHL